MAAHSCLFLLIIVDQTIKQLKVQGTQPLWTRDTHKMNVNDTFTYSSPADWDISGVMSSSVVI